MTRARPARYAVKTDEDQLKYNAILQQIKNDTYFEFGFFHIIPTYYSSVFTSNVKDYLNKEIITFGQEINGFEDLTERDVGYIKNIHDALTMATYDMNLTFAEALYKVATAFNQYYMYKTQKTTSCASIDLSWDIARDIFSVLYQLYERVEEIDAMYAVRQDTIAGLYNRLAETGDASLLECIKEIEALPYNVGDVVLR